MAVTTVERSAKVRGYVKATLKYRKLVDRIAAIEAKAEPLRRQEALVRDYLRCRWVKMTGPQQRHAERLLAQPHDVLELMAKSCRKG